MISDDLMQALCRSKSLSRTFTQTLATSPGILTAFYDLVRLGAVCYLAGFVELLLHPGDRHLHGRSGDRRRPVGISGAAAGHRQTPFHLRDSVPRKESLHRAAPPRRLEPPGAAPIYHKAIEWKWFKEVYYYHRLLFHGCVFLNKLHRLDFYCHFFYRMNQHNYVYILTRFIVIITKWYIYLHLFHKNLAIINNFYIQYKNKDS